MVRFYGLMNEIRKAAKECNFNVDELYSMWEKFSKKYFGLTQDTFKRYCRKISKEEKDNDIKVSKTNVKNIYVKKKSKEFIRTVFLSDLHCGHIAGLTPPQWQLNLENEIYSEYARLQRQVWDFLEISVNELLEERPIDRLIINGDAIDGDGAKCKGTEQITSDMYEQVLMAEECIRLFKCDNIAMTYGSNYHQARGTDFERILADNLGAIIGNDLKLKINNSIVQVKHHVGNSSVPYSKATQVAKAKMNDILDSLKNGLEIADLVVRSHVHKYVYFENTQLGKAFVTPCFQVKSNFGKRYFDGTLDIGFVVVDFYDSGHIDVTPIIADVDIVKEEIIEF